MIHDGRDGGGVDRSLRPESLDVIQRVGIKQLKEETKLINVKLKKKKNLIRV